MARIRGGTEKPFYRKSLTEKVDILSSLDISTKLTFYPNEDDSPVFGLLAIIAWEENFNKKKTSIRLVTEKAKVFIHGDKLTIGKYIRYKEKTGDNNFSTSRCANEALTLNLKTNQFFSTQSTWKNNKFLPSRIYKNTFYRLAGLQEHLPTESVNVFLSYLTKELGFDISSMTLTEIVIEWFIQANNIKVSNSYIHNFINNYPGIENIRKSDYNLVNGIVRKFELKGKYAKKLLNECDSIAIIQLKFLNTLLDINLFNQLLPKVFSLEENRKTMSLNCELRLRHFNFNRCQVTFEVLLKRLPVLSLNEQKNLVCCLNKGSYTITMVELVDHLRFKMIIWEKMGRAILIKAQTADEFKEEHFFFSQLSDYILHPNKSLITLIFHEETIPILEESIIFNGETFNCVLLKSAIDYTEEGLYQGHCVASYATALNSLVISVRKNEIRMTCEFKSSGHSNQSKMRFNHLPEGNWKEVESILAKRVSSIASQPKKYSLNKEVIIEKQDTTKTYFKVIENYNKYKKIDFVADKQRPLPQIIGQPLIQAV